MFCLCAIDNASWGRTWYMQSNGFWTNVKADNLMTFKTADEAVDWAWEKNPHRIYGADYFAEAV